MYYTYLCQDDVFKTNLHATVGAEQDVTSMQSWHHRSTFDYSDEKLMAVQSVEDKKAGKSKKKQGGR